MSAEALSREDCPKRYNRSCNVGIRQCLACSFFALIGLTGVQPPPSPNASVQAWLRDAMGFSAGEVRDVEEGRAVAHQLKLASSVEVSIFGAVRISAPPEAFIEQVRDIEAYERRLGVMAVGKFHDPPRLEDLDALAFNGDDLDALEHCRPTNCDLQLSAAMMQRVAADVRWRDPDGPQQAIGVFRQLLFERLQRYRTAGLAAVDPYVDGSSPLSASDEFQRLQVMQDLLSVPPAFANYVTHFPAAAPPGVEDFYYWNTGDFGMKVTTRVNHVSMTPITGGPPAGVRFAVATTQVYSTHYFSATFELRTVVDDAAKPGQGFYLLYASRSRVSGLTGFMGTLIRPLVKSRARSGMQKYLTNTKNAVEAAVARRPDA